MTGKLSGNPFALRVPANWNGSSVLNAHGYVTPGQPESVPDPATDPSIGLLTTVYAQGYLAANTAYAKTGYAVKEGIDANKALRDFLDAAGSKLEYMTGISMGGNITVGLVEKYPNDFAGAMPYCGVVAGWRAEQRFLLDFRVVYDYYTKGTPYALPGNGDAITYRADYTYPAVQASVVGLFTAAAKGDAAARSILAQVSKVTGVPADVVSYLTPLAGSSYGLQDYLSTAGGNGYTNAGKVYSGSADDAALNAGVQRIAATPAGSAYLDANYTPHRQVQRSCAELPQHRGPAGALQLRARVRGHRGGGGQQRQSGAADRGRQSGQSRQPLRRWPHPLLLHAHPGERGLERAEKLGREGRAPARRGEHHQREIVHPAFPESPWAAYQRFGGFLSCQTGFFAALPFPSGGVHYSTRLRRQAREPAGKGGDARWETQEMGSKHGK